MTKTKKKNKLTHKQRMQMAEEMAGISFWVDLKKGRLSKYTIQKHVKRTLIMIFRYVILVCLGFVIITPLWKLAKDALTHPLLLASKGSVWIPPKISSIFFQIASSKTLMNYIPSILYTVGTTIVLTILQVFSAGIAAYSFARLKFKGNGILFGLVIFTIIVPPDSMMLAQYQAFRTFDLFGIIKLTTGSTINLIDQPVAQFILAGTGIGLKSGLYIYILRQGIKGLPYSIEEAAFVDGAGFLRTFFQIVVPSASGSILTVSVLSFLWNYTDTYYTSLLNNNKKQLAYNYNSIQGNIRWPIDSALNSKGDWLVMINSSNPFVQNAVASACSLLVILPLLVMYLFIQKRFVQGVARSGLGGD